MKRYLLIIPVALGLAITSCKKSTTTIPITDPAIGLKKLASGYAPGAAVRVDIYAEDSLFTGYNRLYISLRDSITGFQVEDAHIHLDPVMQMPGMSHGTPFENPASENAVNHFFPCSITFTMPSSAGNWHLDMEVHNHLAGKEGVASFDLRVKDPATPRLFSFTSAIDAAKYFVAFINPQAPAVGINDMEVVVYKKASMMAFPADSSLSIVLTPEMPVMGHGSPNNVNPVHTGSGHYKGKVNFTMTGQWRLHLDFSAGSTVADNTHYFDLTF